MLDVPHRIFNEHLISLMTEILIIAIINYPIIDFIKRI